MMGTTSLTLTYGEIDFLSFAEIFHVLKEELGLLKDNGGIFYDLGSGVGKGVVAAALLHPFNECFGIELLASLCEYSTSIEASYNTNIQKILEQNDSLFETHHSLPGSDKMFAPKISLFQGDLLKVTAYFELFFISFSMIGAKRRLFSPIPPVLTMT